MIVRFLKSTPILFAYPFSYRKIGRQVVAEMPKINYPTKPKPAEDERLSTKLAHQIFPYLKKDKLPNCRYFAVEYRNRIYHFFNAYYYPLGRMVDKVACAIRGKNSPFYQAHVAQVKVGDVCVIVNIEDPLVTGKKLLFKKLRYHTGFVGHLREYSYRHVLNTKPELLYHFLLRKVMPKNKLSQKYLDNLILVRGPIHNLNNFPQFAPDKKVYSFLSEVNLNEFIKSDPNFVVLEQSAPGLASEIFGRQMPIFEDQRTKEQKRRQSDEEIENLSQIHEDVPKYKNISVLPPPKLKALKGRQKKLEQRYRTVRAPYKKDKKKPTGLSYYTSQKKARKDPNYELLNNEELEQIDEQNTAPNPHVVGGSVQKKE